MGFCQITIPWYAKSLLCIVYGLLSNILIWYIICIVQNACRTRVYVCLDFYFLFEIGLKKLTSKLPMLQYYTFAFSIFHFNFWSKHFTTLYNSFPFLDFYFCYNKRKFFSALKKVTGTSWAVLNSFLFYVVLYSFSLKI